MPKNKGSKKAAAKAPKCTCDDPYKCVCGNRPERPTRGHKWDPDSQQWGGKGHKQKGGSGQTSMTAKSIQTTAIGKTQISEWQKLPTRLLNDFCKKDRRPFPKFKALDRCKKPGNFKFRVIIQDAKVTKRGGEHDFIFIPAGEVSNEEQAREESALLALLHFTPTLPHERTLPEPYKTTWLNTLASIKEEKKNSKASSSNNNQGDGQSNSNHKMDERKPVAKPMSTNVGAKASSNLMQGKSFTSLAEKRQQMDAKKKERNAKIRKHEAFRMANKDAQVFMSAQIRKQIESFLRGNVDEEFMKALTSENEDDIEKDDEDDDIVKSYVIERLVSEGFSKSQAKTSYLATMKNPSPKILSGSTGEDQYMDNVYEECLQWLCIHLNEDQLPEGFDPRGRTLDVVMPTKAVKKSQSNSQNENDTPVEVKHLTEKYGLSIVEAMLVFKATKNKGGKVVDVLHNALYAANKFQQEIDSIEDIQRENIEMNQELANDEIEVLQSMFVIHEDLHIRNDEKNCIIKINMISMDEGDKKRQLIICYERGLYPQTHPKVYVEGGWKEGQGTSFHVQLTNFVISLSTEEPMIFEIYGHVQELLSQLDDNASPMIGGESLIEFLDGGKEYLTSHTQTLNKSSTSKEKKLPSRSTKMPQKHCRPRQKSFFWSKTPKQTPPAISFPKLRTVLEVARKRLPAAKARSEFLSVMEEADRKNRVVLVTGETGCGKTTQIPQFILEEAPKTTKIIVAQPRRLAATGVAGRVANERGEEKPGTGSVGYVVRGDVAMCNSTRLMFCTTGVLLRQLQSEGALDCVSHIVIDEVHERHLDTDILLGILKASRPPHLRIVLMSATMDADRFAGFWGRDTPRMHIPGFTHPVKDFTLEDVLTLTGYVPPKNGKKNGRSGRFNRPKKYSPWADSEHSDDDNDECIANPAKSAPKPSSLNPKSLPLPVEDLVKRVGNDVDYDLIAQLIHHLVERKEAKDDGSILVFLPGAPEINKAQESILRVTKGHGMRLLQLHGGLQPKDQQRVFESAPFGTTKVILSTNVAETSITIPDCTMVIDTCKEKQSSYDPSNRMPLLIETFASRDSLKQRRGRAGRTRPGTCYKLISKQKFDKLPQHGEPEIKRCALDQTLLSLLYLGIEKTSGSFLATLLDPPHQASIDSAIYSLEKLGAITISLSAEKKLSLTPLGIHLAGIPAPPPVGKMLVMGSMLGCRSASLAMAAGMSVGRSPFLRINTFRNNNHSVDEKEEKQEIKNEMILEERKKLSESVGHSDLSLLAAAYLTWDSITGGAKRKYCESIGLSINSIRDMKKMVNQLDGSLSAAGFRSAAGSDMNAKSWRIIRSCIVASLAPSQIVRVQRSSTKYEETVEGAVKKDGNAKELKFFTRSDIHGDKDTEDMRITKYYHNIAEERVFIHPSSANFSVGDYSCPWLVFHELVRTSKPFLRDANECNIYDLLLFGGNLQVSSSEGVIIIDDYVRLSANARIGALIGGLRRKVDEVLSQKVANPALEVEKSVEMRLIVKLLKTDGLGV